MIKKRGLIWIVMVMSIGLCLGGIYVFKEKVFSGSAKIDYWSSGIKDLSSNSQVIIQGNVTEEQKEIKYDDISFVITKVKIGKIYKGYDLLKGNLYIELLQTKIEDDPTVIKNSEVLLFLEKYKGPIIDDAFVCKGLFQGQYMVKDGSIVVVKNKNKQLNKEFEQIKELDNLKNFIK